MLLYFLLLLAVGCFGIRLVRENENYLSKTTTTCVNGWFLLLVFYRHLTQYAAYHSLFDQPMRWINTKLDQYLVVTFLFYSGFAIMESIRNKDGYVRKIPRKRVLKTWGQFAACVCLFLVVQLCFGNRYSFSGIITGLLGWSSFGNSNWYIFSMLWMWIITWLSFTLCRSHRKLAVALDFLLSAVYILLLSRWKDAYWYNTVLCYPAGMLFSLLRPQIEGRLKQNSFWVPAILLAGALTLLSYHFRRRSIWIYELCAVLAAVTVVVLTMRVQVGNRVLNWIGSHLFGLYILQRLPMIVLRNLGLADAFPYVFAAACIGITALLGWGFGGITGKIDAAFGKLTARSSPDQGSRGEQKPEKLQQ